MKLLKWSFGVLGGLIVLVAGSILWILQTQSGARWVVALATDRFLPALEVGSVSGTLTGPLTLRDVRFRGDGASPQIRVASASVDVAIRALFSTTLLVEHGAVEGLVVNLPATARKPEPAPPGRGFSLEPPIAIEVRQFELEHASIRRAQKSLFGIDSLWLAAGWTREGIDIGRLLVRPADFPGQVHLSGDIAPVADARTLPRADLTLRWERVVLPERLVRQELHTHGELEVEGTLDGYFVGGRLTVGRPGALNDVPVRIAGNRQRVVIQQLELLQHTGRFGLHGTLDIEPRLGWQLEANAKSFDPGEFFPAWPGSIDLDLATAGRLADNGPQGRLRLESLEGVLRERPISGKGEIDVTATMQLIGDLEVRSGSSRVAITGKGSAERKALDARVSIQVATLKDWLPAADGAVQGQFQVKGMWPDVGVLGKLNGNSLALGEGHIGGVQLTLNVRHPVDPDGELSMVARQVSAAGLEFARVALSAEGRRAAHMLDLSAQGEPLTARLSLRGGLEGTSWKGTLDSLHLLTPNVPPLALHRPATISYGGGAASIGQICLAGGSIRACAAADTKPDGSLRASYSLTDVPLAIASAFASGALPGTLQGHIGGEGRIRRAADGSWFGTVRIESPSSSITLASTQLDAPGAGRKLLLYEDLLIRARLAGDEANGDVGARLTGGGQIKGNGSVNGLGTAGAAIDGEVNARLATLAPFAPFLPPLSELDGEMNARAIVAGTIGEPEITGEVSAGNLAAHIVKLGIDVRAGTLEAGLDERGNATLSGGIESGDGRLAFEGAMRRAGDVRIRLEGRNFLAANIPAARVLLTPDLEFTREQGQLQLTGKVTIPEAAINLERLPQSRQRAASGDVIVVRNGVVVEDEGEPVPLPLHAKVTVVIGEEFHVEGYGLDSTLTGQLVVNEDPATPTTASGELKLSGQFRRYGQDLTIDEGRIIYTGNPIDDPRLNITANRKLEEVTAAIRITGSAKQPQLSVSSEPPVGTADALSYLVAGRPLSGVGTSDDETQEELQSAQQRVGAAAGGLVAKRIGNRLGVDEVGVEQSELIGGQAFTLGEYLSPRLFLSYGIGLFEPGEVISLRYSVSEEVGVRIQRGSEEVRGGLEYQIEK